MTQARIKIQSVGAQAATSSARHLRKQQQAISAKIFGTIGKALEEPGALTDWLNTGASRKASDVDVVASTKGAMAA
jgi:hypothetical protein